MTNNNTTTLPPHVWQWVLKQGNGLTIRPCTRALSDNTTPFWYVGLSTLLGPGYYCFNLYDGLIRLYEYAQTKSTTTPTCPLCGAALFSRQQTDPGELEFDCKTVTKYGVVTVESAGCLRRQRDNLKQQLSELQYKSYKQ